jgi:transposase InsO family protein
MRRAAQGAHSARLACQRAGIEPSVGSWGDSYGNALAETINGFYKTELIHRRAPWKTRESVGWRHSSGSTGSSISDCWSRLAMYRRLKLRQTTGASSLARLLQWTQLKSTGLHGFRGDSNPRMGCLFISRSLPYLSSLSVLS